MMQRGFGARRVARRVPLCVEQLEGRLVLSHAAGLSTSAWTAVGPAPLSGVVSLLGAQAGRVEAFAAHPADPNTVYIATDQGGVWKSTNWLSTNPTWTPLTDGQPSLRSNVHSLAVARSNPNVIYAGAAGPGGGVLKSIDGGASWSLLGGTLFDGSEFGAIVVSPTDANTVYVATNCGPALAQGVFKTIDGGVTWANTTASIHAGCVSDLVADPTNQSVFYAGFVRDPGNLTDGVYKTTNAGLSWTRLSAGLPFGAMIGESITLAVAPSFSATVYATIIDAATGRPGRFRSLNNGSSWNTLATLPTAEETGAEHVLLAVELNDSNTLFVNGAGLVYRSTNGGSNWSQVLSGADPVAAYFDLAGAIVLVADQGIYRSTNLGGTWSNRQGNLQITEFHDLALDPTNAEILFGVVQDSSGFVATNGSLAWSQLSAGSEPGRIIVNPATPRVLFGYTPRQPAIVLRSDDGGVTWLAKNAGIDPTEFAGVASALDVARSITMDAANPDHLLIGAARVYETTSRGDTWTAISGELSPGQRITSLEFAPSSSLTVYAGTTDGGFFRSIDGGRTWTRRDSGLAPAQTWDIEIDPTNAGRLFVGLFATSNASVYFSGDGGTTWSNVSGDLPANDQTRTLAVDWRVPTPELYAGTGHGVFRSINGGVTWSRSFASDMPNTVVRDLELVPGLNILAAGTFGRGAFELRVPPFATTTPDLMNADDSGTSSTDDLTNVVRPRFTGTGWPGAVRVELLEGPSVVGTSIVDAATGVWSAQIAADLTEGIHAIKARVVHPLGHLSVESLTTTITIDTTPPAAPSTPDLNPASDTGVSTNDDVTADQTPNLTGTSDVGSTILVFSDLAGLLDAASAADGTWSVTVGPLGDGPHRVSASAIDAAGNASGRSAELLVTIDTTPPFSVPSVPDLVAASDSGVSNTDNITNVETPTFTGSVVPNGPVVVLLNGGVLGSALADATGSWSFTTAALANGVYDVSARITDLAGNLGPFSPPATVTIDTVVPAPSIPDLAATSDTGLFDSDDVTRDATPEFAGAAEPGSSVSLVSSIAGPIGVGTAGPLGDWRITTVAIANGTHQISAVATDRAGNTSISSLPASVVIDTVTPAAPASPDLGAASDSGVSSDDNVTNIRTPFLSGTAPAGTRLTVASSLSGELATLSVGTSGNWSFTSRALAEGIHAITATAADLAGNTSAPSPVLLVTIDTIPPSTPSPPDLFASSDSGASDADNVTRDVRPVFAGTAEPGSAVTVFAGGQPVGSVNADAAGAWSVATAVLADGVYSVTARASDAAGNSSGPSVGLTVGIDSAIATPTTPDLDGASDSGGSNSDDVTNLPTIRVTGIVEPLSAVTIFDGATVLGTASADGVGRWSLLTGPSEDGVRLFSVRATDPAGNESAASGVLAVQVDTTAPAVPAPPVLVDDTGLPSDNRTNVRRPRVTGAAEPRAHVELLVGGELVGSGDADSAGSFTIQSSRNLADGEYAVRVRASDAAGNSSTSASVRVAIDGSAPQAIGLSPAGVSTEPVLNLVLSFNDDDLVSSRPGEPRFDVSVVNPANYSLVGSGGDGLFGNGNDRAIELAASRFDYDAAADRLDLAILTTSGSPVFLPNDAYRFAANGTTSVRDVAGNSLSGGDFVRTFTVSVAPPRVADVTMADKKRTVSQIVLSFTLPLDAASAADAGNYQVFSPGRDRRFGTPDDSPLGVGTPVYEASSQTVTLRPPSGFAAGRFVRLVVRDTLAGATRSPLDGDADGDPGGDWTAEIGRGRTFSYQELDGDTVNLFLLGSGRLDLVWSPLDAGPRVRIRDVAPGVSTLTGGFRRARGGDGLATIQSVTPAAIALIRLPTNFRIVAPPIAALVDTVLESSQQY